MGGLLMRRVIGAVAAVLFGVAAPLSSTGEDHTDASLAVLVAS